MLYKLCCLRCSIFIRRNTSLPPRNQSGINVDFIQRRNVFNFHTHSTRNIHKKREACRQKFMSKITPESNRRDWTCRSHEYDFNTVIYIVKWHIQPISLTNIWMTLQMIGFKVYSGSQYYIIFHILYFVEPLGTGQHLFTTMAWHQNRRHAISVSNGDPFYWWLQMKCNYYGSWVRNIVHSRHLAVTFLQGLYHSW